MKPFYMEVVWEHNNNTTGANITWGEKSYSSDGVKRNKVWESKLKYKIYFLIMFSLFDYQVTFKRGVFNEYICLWY